MDGPFLHLINYDADPEHEHAFDVWYNIHILNVLKCPAYQWSSRYVSLEGDFEGPHVRNLTLYMIEDRSAFDVVLTRNEGSRPPALKKDQEDFRALQGVRYVHSSVYEQIGGSHLGKPLLMANRPLLLALSDASPGREAEWDRWSEEEELPALMRDPWVVTAGRFRAVDGIIPPWLTQGPRYLTLCELRGEAAAGAMFDPEGMSPALRGLVAPDQAPAQAARRLRYFYRPISQHWSFKKDPR